MVAGRRDLPEFGPYAAVRATSANARLATGPSSSIFATPKPANASASGTRSGNQVGSQTECARQISELQGGSYIRPSKTTVAQFLHQWLEHIQSHVSPRTHERYAELLQKNIAPLLGAVHLTKLRPAQIAAAYAKALQDGRKDGKGGLSPNTVVYIHRVIKQALAHVVRWEIISRSPADAVNPPKVERATMSTYDIAQTVELLEAVRGTRLLVPVILGVLCGLRRGEIIALRGGRSTSQMPSWP